MGTPLCARTTVKAIQLALLYQARALWVRAWAPAEQEDWVYCLVTDTNPLVPPPEALLASPPLPPAVLQGVQF